MEKKSDFRLFRALCGGFVFGFAELSPQSEEVVWTFHRYKTIGNSASNS